MVEHPKLSEEYLDALTHRKVNMKDLILFDGCGECGDKLDHDCLDNTCGRIRLEASEMIMKLKAELKSFEPAVPCKKCGKFICEHKSD